MFFRKSSFKSRHSLCILWYARPFQVLAKIAFGVGAGGVLKKFEKRGECMRKGLIVLVFLGLTACSSLNKKTKSISTPGKVQRLF